LVVMTGFTIAIGLAKDHVEHYARHRGRTWAGRAVIASQCGARSLAKRS
jgi:hypothetical protein